MAKRPYAWDHGPLRSLPADRRLVLVTVHRRESFGPPLRNICEALRELAARYAVGTDPAAIVATATRLLDDPAEHARMARAVKLYGDGHAAERTVRHLLDAHRSR